MMRAGLIKRLGAGIYTYMPMGLRVIRKVEAIVREEMNRAGAVELLMPVVQPAELWQETGRFEKIRPRAAARQGPPRARLRDPADQRRGHHRHRAPGAAQLQAAAEEFLPHPDQVPRRAPAALRRDARPRVHDEGRLLASTATSTAAQASYDAHVRTPTARIFDRFGLRYRAVAADSGAIGGDLLARVPGDRRHRRGRDRLLPRQRLRRQHRAGRGAGAGRRRAAPPTQPLAKTPTPGKSTCEDVAALLGVPLAQHGEVAGARHRRARRRRRRRASRTIWLLLVRGDHDMNEIKAGKVPGLEARLPLRDRRRDRGALRLQAGLPRPDRPEAAGARSSPTARSRR